MVMAHSSRRIADKSTVTYYGNSAMMNALEQLKVNLNWITCCFEYTSLIRPSLMYYQVH